ncbi:MAG TPA: hypothetical protein GXZ38_02105 [Spirochaetales bacterium]|nr:hypothetical protein [Spirochaetales bacterium]
MKKRLLVVLLVLLLSLTSLFAANKRLGIGTGLVLRAPFAIGAVGEYDFGPARVNLTLGYQIGSFLLGVGGEYVFPGLFQNNDLNFGLKMSVGGRIDLGFSSDYTLIRIGVPVTFAYYFDSVPIKIYGSGIPGVMISLYEDPFYGPSNDALLSAQVEIGAMWLF